MPPIEKRFRRELNALRFDPGREAFVVDTGTVETKVVLDLLDKVFNGRVTVTLVPKGTRKRKGVYLPSSLEHELCRELRNFLEDEDEHSRFPVLLGTIPEELILAYAKRHKLAGKPLAPRDDVRELLESLQEKQPQTKAALRKSFAYLREAAEKRA